MCILLTIRGRARVKLKRLASRMMNRGVCGAQYVQYPCIQMQSKHTLARSKECATIPTSRRNERGPVRPEIRGNGRGEDWRHVSRDIVVTLLLASCWPRASPLITRLTMDPYTPRTRPVGRKKNLALSTKEYTKVRGKRQTSHHA